MTFELGARTAWHTHPLGQTLIVTSGCGWTQCSGEPKKEIRPGDVIWCPPGKKHWHGAEAYENAVPADSFARAVAFAMMAWMLGGSLIVQHNLMIDNGVSSPLAASQQRQAQHPVRFG